MLLLFDVVVVIVIYMCMVNYDCCCRRSAYSIHFSLFFFRCCRCYYCVDVSVLVSQPKTKCNAWHFGSGGSFFFNHEVLALPSTTPILMENLSYSLQCAAVCTALFPQSFCKANWNDVCFFPFHFSTWNLTHRCHAIRLLFKWPFNSTCRIIPPIFDGVFRIRE